MITVTIKNFNRQVVECICASCGWCCTCGILHHTRCEVSFTCWFPCQRIVVRFLSSTCKTGLHLEHLLQRHYRSITLQSVAKTTFLRSILGWEQKTVCYRPLFAKRILFWLLNKGWWRSCILFNGPERSAMLLWCVMYVHQQSHRKYSRGFEWGSGLFQILPKSCYIVSGLPKKICVVQCSRGSDNTAVHGFDSPLGQ